MSSVHRGAVLACRRVVMDSALRPGKKRTLDVSGSSPFPSFQMPGSSADGSTGRAIRYIYSEPRRGRAPASSWLVSVGYPRLYHAIVAVDPGQYICTESNNPRLKAAHESKILTFSDEQSQAGSAQFRLQIIGAFNLMLVYKISNLAPKRGQTEKSEKMAPKKRYSNPNVPTALGPAPASATGLRMTGPRDRWLVTTSASPSRGAQAAGQEPREGVTTGEARARQKYPGE
ncbi:unnamed protein product [Trichogramma brassicae]|uniref:Uncharacterized protein n=1 Tax=Trichogramma brassicae TaxID=86971 RepID=A0A6H5I1M4_9HYME|nr:unnamed protein product [Trichogramma brassicae]